LWRAEAGSPVVSTPSGLVLARQGRALVAIDATGSARALGAGLSLTGGAVARDERHLVVRDEHHLAAFDPATLAQRWRIECPAGQCNLHVRAAGPRFVVAGNIVLPGLETGVLALDAATGQELWRTVLPFDSLAVQLVADEARAILIESGSLVALDAATGERQWARALRQSLLFSHGALLAQRGSLAAFVDPRVAVHLVDAADGEDLFQIPFEDTVTDLAFDASALYVAGDRRLLAFDTQRRAVRFDRPIDGWAATPALALDDAIGWIRTAQDESRAHNDSADRVVAFDLATGAPVAYRDLGESTSMGIARGASGQGVLVADVPGGKLVALGLGPRPEPDHEGDVLVHVRVPPPYREGAASPSLGGVRVRVGSATLGTAEDGTIRLRARGIGVARVDLLDVHRFAEVLECPRPVSAFLDFGAREPAYEIDLLVGPGHCR
jgi:hypothetical protein